MSGILSTYFNNNERFNSEFADEIMKYKMDAPFTRITKALQECCGFGLYGIPTRIRLWHLCDTVNKNPGIKIDWREIDSIILMHKEYYDYQLHRGIITSVKDLFEEKEEAFLAFENKEYWHIRLCKNCEDEYGLYKSEVKFYLNKNFSLPRRCKKCRAESSLSEFEVYSMKRVLGNARRYYKDYYGDCREKEIPHDN